jgi:hypothetical protein
VKSNVQKPILRGKVPIDGIRKLKTGFEKNSATIKMSVAATVH